MLSERTFVLDGPDGEPIRGDLRHPARGAAPRSGVVVLHGFKGFRNWGFFPHVCRELARDGHIVASFDFSRNGVGRGGEDFDQLEAFARNTFTRELEEVHMVCQALRAGDLPAAAPERIALLGHSRGGGTAVLAAAEGAAHALVTWAAVATFDRWDDLVKEEWRRRGRIHVANARTGQDMPLDVTLLDDLERNGRRLDVEAAARRLGAGQDRLPWLIVHGSDDASVPVEEGRRLAAAAHRGAEGHDAPVHLEVIDGAGHTFGASHPFQGVGPHLEAALHATRAHLRSFSP
jgi:uncharacterized protein